MSRNLNTTLLEIFLIFFIIAIVVSGTAFYAINFTDIGRDFFNQFFVKNSKPTKIVTVNLKTEPHNQIVLKLSDDKIVTSNISATDSIYYEFSPGIKIATEWPISSTGFLVYSSDQGKTITLIGSDFFKADKKLAETGVDALQDLDSNSDSKIDKDNINYRHLYVWIDKNNNAIVDDGELFTLDQLGIKSIDLDTIKPSHESINNSTIVNTGNYTLKDGTTKTFVDIDLFQNPFYREFVDRYPLNSTIQKFPDLKGTGRVRDLREASILNIKLFTRVANYLKIEDAEKQLKEMDRLLFDWVLASSSTFLSARAEALSTLNFNVSLDNALLINNYLNDASDKEVILRKMRILEAFSAKKIISFLGEENFNPITKKWELIVTVLYNNEVISKKTFINDALNDPLNISIMPDMLPLSDHKIIDINNRYSELRDSLLINFKEKIRIAKALSESNWITNYIKSCIEASEKYHYLNQSRAPDIRRRPLLECIKPNNVIDEQVIGCASGKIAKTW